MPTDFERQLSELLHTVTPEPPDYVASPRGVRRAELSRAEASQADASQTEASPADASPADAAAAVVELAQTGHPRRRRWTAILAAAAVAALAAGVVAATELGTAGHHAPHQSPAAGPMTTTTASRTAPNAGGTRRCSSDQLAVARNGFTVHGRAGTARLSYRNSWAKPCALKLPAVAIGTDPTQGTPFPASAQTVQLPGHRRVVITAHARVTGRCHKVRHGLRINVTRGPFTYSFPLRVTGCTLTPLRLTRRIAG